MAFFNEFPYTRTYDADLGWLIRRIQEVAAIVDEYVSLNSIEFADPINWDITTQYPRLTIVLDRTGGAYISRQPVPAGVPLTNTDYWTEIYNTAAVINSIRENIAHDNGDIDTATKDISAYDLFWYAGNLYYATERIAPGNRFIEGTNCRRMTVDEKINLLIQTVRNELQTAIAQEAQDRNDADVALGNRIDAEIQDRQDADTALGSRIDTEIQDRQNADTALDNKIDAETAARLAAEAIIIEQIENNKGYLDYFKNRRVVIIGDSLSDNDTNPPNWTQHFTNIVRRVNAQVLNLAQDGQSFLGQAQSQWLDPILAEIRNDDIVIIQLGTNDCNGGALVNNTSWKFLFSGTPTGDSYGSAKYVFEKILERTQSDVWYIAPARTGAAFSEAGRYLPLTFYRDAFARLAKSMGISLIDWSGLPRLSGYFDPAQNMPDGLHPSADYALAIANYTIKKMGVGGDAGIMEVQTKIGNVVYRGTRVIFGGAVSFPAGQSQVTMEEYMPETVWNNMNALPQVRCRVPSGWNREINVGWERIGTSQYGRAYLVPPIDATEAYWYYTFDCVLGMYETTLSS